MKKQFVPFALAGIALLLLFATGGCKKNQDETTYDPFNTGSSTRNLIVVISDIHLGADLSYAECKNNVGPLASLLGKIRSSQNVKELVIAGDLVDEWFVPATTDTYQGKDQADFVDRVATANKPVFDQLKAIITDGIIKVTYAPGNHDLTVSGSNIDRVLPGVNQARDAGLLGLGTYYPDNQPLIAIEHGHRYNLYCAPDPISNQDVAPGTILPPGYFYTRIAALHVVQNCTIPADTCPPVTPNTSGGTSQQNLYYYWQFWDASLTGFPISNRFSENMIVTNVNGFTGNYSVNDVLPYQSTPGGTIAVNLFNGVQDSWQQRCTMNNVPVAISATYAVVNSSSHTAIDSMSYIQYFMNPSSDARLVVFGHTHVPLIQTFTNHAGLKSVYVNSGTWIDNNPKLTTMNFVIITPQSADPASQTSVVLYNFQQSTCNEMTRESLRL